MATIDVKDAGGNTVPIEKPLTPGRAAATTSRPVVLSTEDKASIDSLLTGVVLSTSTNIIGKIDHSSSGIGHGVKTVTTAGTDVALVASSTPAKWVVVQAQTDNTGNIAVGATGVDATESTGTGILLAASESITLPVDNLTDVFIDASVSGDGVRFTYGT